MIISFVQNQGNERLILIMAGWSMDPRPFKDLSCDGYDIAVAWDYTDEHVDGSKLQSYREVVLIAWSMGVYETARVIPGLNLPISLSIAVNGTEFPVDDLRGIPNDVFTGTLDSLSEVSLPRFNRRMCGSREALARFDAVKPERSIDSLREELRVIGERAATGQQTSLDWGLVLIGANDMIFPAKAQREAWKGRHIIEIDSPHYPDFQSIIDRYIIDKVKVARCFELTRQVYNTEASLQHKVAQSLIDKLLKNIPSRHFPTIVEIGGGSGRLSRLVADNLTRDRYEIWDIAPMTLNITADDIVPVVDDAEILLASLPDNSIDLFVSSSTLQWMNSPLGAMRNMARALKPGGTLAIAVYCDGTYRDVAQQLGSTLHYHDHTEYINTLTDCQMNISYSTDCLTVDFPDTRSLLDHIRATGVNATRSVDTATLRDVLRNNTLRSLQYNTLYIIATKS